MGIVEKPRLTWYIEKDFCESKEITDVARELGYEVVDFTYHSLAQDYDWKHKIYPRISTPEPALFYGSINSMKLARKSSHIPGVWLDFDYLSYAPKLGKYLLNEDYRVLPLREVARLRESVFFETDRYTKRSGYSIFIKPNSGLKPFDGQVVEYNLCNEWYNEQVRNGASPEALCIFSSAKEIYSEERFVVADGKVLTGCTYSRNGDINYKGVYSSLSWKWLEKVLKDTEFNPYPVYVVDIATYNGDISPGVKRGIIECNSINCAGFYGCDLQLVVKEASKLAMEEYDEYINLD